MDKNPATWGLESMGDRQENRQLLHTQAKRSDRKAILRMLWPPNPELARMEWATWILIRATPGENKAGAPAWGPRRDSTSRQAPGGAATAGEGKADPARSPGNGARSGEAQRAAHLQE